MIGIDSNVLIYAVIDSADPIKAAKAKKVISDNAPVFVNTVVLAEFAWTCKQSFAMERLEIHRRLEAIVASPEFEFAHPEALAKAVAGYGSHYYSASGRCDCNTAIV